MTLSFAIIGVRKGMHSNFFMCMSVLLACISMHNMYAFRGLKRASDALAFESQILVSQSMGARILTQHPGRVDSTINHWGIYVALQSNF